jgi:hypothetical protein
LTNREDELYDKNLGEETILGFYKNDLWEVTKEVFGFEYESNEEFEENMKKAYVLKIKTTSL